MKIKMQAVLGLVCPYCKGRSRLVKGNVIYPHRSDLYDKDFYLCRPCDAYVGCHTGTTIPLGRLANAELRRAKLQAHAAFDPIWKNGHKSRGGAYAWLSEQLNISKELCHIGMFDVDQCRRVTEVCQEFHDNSI